MGIYVNPGNTAFREAVNSKIYVDKSELISYTNSVLNTKQKTCVSAVRAVLGNLWLRICLQPTTVKAVIPQSYLPA